MSYKLFLDDERFPVDETYLIAHSSKEALELLINFGLPDKIAFDHDLGEEDTAIKYIWGMVDFIENNNLKIPATFEFSIHSQNPIGTENIRSLMNNIIHHFG